MLCTASQPLARWGEDMMIGLNSESSAAESGYDKLDFALYCHGRKITFWFNTYRSTMLSAYENGKKVVLSSTSYHGQVLKIVINDGKVQYYRDGELLRTSSSKPRYPVHADVSMRTPDSAIYNAH